MKKRMPVLLVILALMSPMLAQALDAELVLEHGAGAVTASWNADETRILSASQNGLAQVWSAEDGEILLAIDHDGKPLTHALWINGGEAILSADESGRVLYSAANDGELIRNWQLDGMPLQLAPNAAETQAFVFSAEGKGWILSLQDGEITLEVERSGSISGAGWSADETKVRAWSEDGRVVVWDVETGAEVATFSMPHRAMLLGLEWNSDDTRVLAWFTDGNAHNYETDGIGVSRRSISSVRHRSFVRRAIWSADESLVMSWAADDTVHIWSAADGRSRQVFRHEDWVIGAGWDSEEQRLLSWSHIYIYLWDDEGVAVRLPHRNLVRGAVWNDDASRILSWSWDGTVRVWAA